MKDLHSSTFLIATHVYATGPSFKLVEFLYPRAKRVIFIGHPFSYAKDTRSFLHIYEDGKLVHKKEFLAWRGPELVFYLKDVVLTVFWSIRYTKSVDYFFGVDSLNAAVGNFLKSVGLVKRTIFYTIDYVPMRFESRLLNSIYHWFDREAVRKSDTVWNLSTIMRQEREARGVSKSLRNKQITVPVGTDEIAPQRSHRFNKQKIVFMGHLRPGQGVELLIDSIFELVRKFPKLQLLIIGGGPLESRFRNLIKQRRLQKNITITGFVKEYADVKKLLHDAAFAIAPYTDDNKTYTRYTDPGKPKDYLAAGLPVIITKVPQVAYEIHRRKAGIAIDDDKKSLVEAITKLLTSKDKLLAMSQNARSMAERYRWDTIFTKALSQSI